MNPRAQAMAEFLWRARQARETYRNLPAELTPADFSEAYEGQEAYYRLAEPIYGPVAGAKIATTTKVMQELMGIPHPCGGAIFARTIHKSPARLKASEFVNLRIECEIALRLSQPLPVAGAPWNRESVTQAVVTAMPAYELIEDRHAVYRETDAKSMIVDNCWNGGIVIGPGPEGVLPELVGIAGRLTINDQPVADGRAEDPYATLAWLANQVAERGRSLQPGMIVITGSIVATVSIAPGDRAVFTVDGLGEAVLEVT
jgi:2-keto-4-pentenoate hydratase